MATKQSVENCKTLPLNKVHHRDDITVFGKTRKFPLGGLNRETRRTNEVYSSSPSSSRTNKQPTESKKKKKNCGCSKKQKSHQTQIRVFIDIIADLEGFSQILSLFFFSSFQHRTRCRDKHQFDLFSFLFIYFCLFYPRTKQQRSQNIENIQRYKPKMIE